MKDRNVLESICKKTSEFFRKNFKFYKNYYKTPSVVRYVFEKKFSNISLIYVYEIYEHLVYNKDIYLEIIKKIISDVKKEMSSLIFVPFFNPVMCIKYVIFDSSDLNPVDIEYILFNFDNYDYLFYLELVKRTKQYRLNVSLKKETEEEIKQLLKKLNYDVDSLLKDSSTILYRVGDDSLMSGYVDLSYPVKNITDIKNAAYEYVQKTEYVVHYAENLLKQRFPDARIQCIRKRRSASIFEKTSLNLSKGNIHMELNYEARYSPTWHIKYEHLALRMKSKEKTISYSPAIYDKNIYLRSGNQVFVKHSVDNDTLDILYFILDYHVNLFDIILKNFKKRKNALPWSQIKHYYELLWSRCHIGAPVKSEGLMYYDQDIAIILVADDSQLFRLICEHPILKYRTIFYPKFADKIKVFVIYKKDVLDIPNSITLSDSKDVSGVIFDYNYKINIYVKELLNYFEKFAHNLKKKYKIGTLI